jgi:arylsulfatase A-like enzyme
MGDNGPSREARNWLDGNPDPYYGGSAGKLKGHKFSLYDGGIRVPALIKWPGVISPGKVCSQPIVAMDIMPTFVKAAGGDPSAYDVDGMDIHSCLRQLVEGAPPEDDVHLANLAEDMGETVNRKDQNPDLTVELKTAAEEWQAQIDETWEEMQKNPSGTVTYI